MVDLYYRESKALGEKKETKLPLVLPIIFAHGSKQFQAPVQFAELVDAPLQFAQFVPQFKVLLFDLMAYAFEELPTVEDNPEVEALTQTMRAVVSDEEGEILTEITRRFAHAVHLPQYKDLLEALWGYILKYGSVTNEQIEFIQHKVSKIGEMIWAFQH